MIVRENNHLNILAKGLKGESKGSTIFLYLTAILIVAPLGALVDFKWGDNVACEAVILGAILLPILILILGFLLRYREKMQTDLSFIQDWASCSEFKLQAYEKDLNYEKLIEFCGQPAEKRSLKLTWRLMHMVTWISRGFVFVGLGLLVLGFATGIYSGFLFPDHAHSPSPPPQQVDSKPDSWKHLLLKFISLPSNGFVSGLFFVISFYIFLRTVGEEGIYRIDLVESIKGRRRLSFAFAKFIGILSSFENWLLIVILIMYCSSLGFFRGDAGSPSIIVAAILVAYAAKSFLRSRFRRMSFQASREAIISRLANELRNLREENKTKTQSSVGPAKDSNRV